MKNFYDLLDIDLWIDIEIKTQTDVLRLRWPLLKPLDLVHQSPISVLVDGMEVLQFGYLTKDAWHMHHDEPFYRWRHRVTGQGWLLEPVKIEARVSNGNV